MPPSQQPAPYPDLASPSPTLFPTFSTLPFFDGDDGDGTASAPSVLLAQVKTNMTITKPTLICTDLSGVDFAITFEAPSFDLSAYKAGKTTLAVRGARRTRPEGSVSEGRSGKGFVRVPAGEEGAGAVVRVPAGLGRARELAAKARGGEGGGKCACCGTRGDGDGDGDEEGMKRCTGCLRVMYCGKDCQVKGWAEEHKTECKVYKALNEVFGGV